MKKETTKLSARERLLKSLELKKKNLEKKLKNLQEEFDDKEEDILDDITLIDVQLTALRKK